MPAFFSASQLKPLSFSCHEEDRAVYLASLHHVALHLLQDLFHLIPCFLPWLLTPSLLFLASKHILFCTACTAGGVLAPLLKVLSQRSPVLLALDMGLLWGL